MATQTIMTDRDYLDRYRDKLPASVHRAKWIGSPDQHADRDGQTLATRNHDVIRNWAQDRQAAPATIAGTQHDGRLGVLRFDFPGGASGGSLQEVSWDDWFATFDARQLVLLYQETLSEGSQSNFNILNNPNREDG